MVKESNGSNVSMPKLSNYNSNTVGPKDEAQVMEEDEEYGNNTMNRSSSAIMPKQLQRGQIASTKQPRMDKSKSTNKLQKDMLLSPMNALNINIHENRTKIKNGGK